jgi:acyl-CoA hydrolase
VCVLCLPCLLRLAPLQMTGRVVWTGSSSVDIRMELEQAGQLQLTALFTFVARDMLTNRPHAISPLTPKSRQVRLCWLPLLPPCHCCRRHAAAVPCCCCFNSPRHTCPRAHSTAS